MKVARNLILAAVCGFAVLATAPRIASAQFMPDYPTGGTAPNPNGGGSGPELTSAPVINWRQIFNFRVGLVSYGWVLPQIKTRAANRSAWLTLRRRVAR
jgi:hypothetical protein